MILIYFLSPLKEVTSKQYVFNYNCFSLIEQIQMLKLYPAALKR